MKQTTRLVFTLALVLAAWPRAATNAAPRCYPPSRFSSVDGLVRDALTRVMWQGEASTGTMKWPAAKTYCSSSGLRLPTMKELASIVDPQVGAGPRIYQQAFPNTPLALFWTSTPYAGSSDYAWYVDFSNGLSSNIGVGSELRVRCVR